MTYWHLLAYGAAATIVFSKGTIFEKIRDVGPCEDPPFLVLLWRSLSNCPLCTGTWVGIFLSLAFGGLSGPLSVQVVQALGFGALTGVAAMTAWNVIDALNAFATAQEATANGLLKVAESQAAMADGIREGHVRSAERDAEYRADTQEHFRRMEELDRTAADEMSRLPTKN